jgi:hypothetical protein
MDLVEVDDICERSLKRLETESKFGNLRAPAGSPTSAGRSTSKRYSSR